MISSQPANFVFTRIRILALENSTLFQLANKFINCLCPKKQCFGSGSGWIWVFSPKKAQCVEWTRIRNFRIGSGRSGLRKNVRSGSGKKVRIQNTVKKTDLLSVSAWQYLLSNAMLAMTMASISRALPWAWSSLLVTSCTFLVMDRTPWVTVPGRRPLSNFFWMPLNKKYVKQRQRKSIDVFSH